MLGVINESAMFPSQYNESALCPRCKQLIVIEEDMMKNPCDQEKKRHKSFEGSDTKERRAGHNIWEYEPHQPLINVPIPAHNDIIQGGSEECRRM